MKTITLTNSFHNTSVRVSDLWEVEGEGQAAAWLQIQYHAQWRRDPAAIRVMKRIEKTLCGMSDCRCGTVRA